MKRQRTIIISIAAITVLIAATLGYRRSDLLSELAGQGNPGEQRLLGERYYAQGDKEEALKWMLKAAEGQDPIAQNLMGSYYAGSFKDQLPPKVDYTRAREWFEKAAAQDFETSQYELCRMYHLGLGVKQDQETAYFWCSLADVFGAARKLKQLAGQTLDQEALRRVESKLTAWQHRKDRR